LECHLEVHDLPIAMEVSAMLHGTQLTPLQKSLSLDPPTSLANLFPRANKYMLHTEVMRAVGGNKNREQKRKERDVEEDSRWVRGSDIPRPQFHHYIKLLQPRSTILTTMERSGLIRLSKKVDHPMEINREEYCKYHKTLGHSID